MGRHAEKKQEKVVEGNKTCWLQRQDGVQYRWVVGAGVPREKVTKGWSRGIDPPATNFKVRTEPDSKGLVGAGTTKQSRGQREPTGGP